MAGIAGAERQLLGAAARLLEHRRVVGVTCQVVQLEGIGRAVVQLLEGRSLGTRMVWIPGIGPPGVAVTTIEPAPLVQRGIEIQVSLVVLEGRSTAQITPHRRSSRALFWSSRALFWSSRGWILRHGRTRHEST